jgi:magnesium chelatase family protein
LAGNPPVGNPLGGDTSSGDTPGAGGSEPSSEIRARVAAARARQLSRQGMPNAQMSGEQLAAHCGLSREGAELLRAAYDRFALSARAYNRILKVARTRADLDESPRIAASHLAEAIRYRNSGMLNT